MNTTNGGGNTLTHQPVICYNYCSKLKLLYYDKKRTSSSVVSGGDGDHYFVNNDKADSVTTGPWLDSKEKLLPIYRAAIKRLNQNKKSFDFTMNDNNVSFNTEHIGATISPHHHQGSHHFILKIAYKYSNDQCAFMSHILNLRRLKDSSILASTCSNSIERTFLKRHKFFRDLDNCTIDFELDEEKHFFIVNVRIIDDAGDIECVRVIDSLVGISNSKMGEIHENKIMFGIGTIFPTMIILSLLGFLINSR
jgi:hypothetical protein